jgi:hypothetical protein
VRTFITSDFWRDQFDQQRKQDTMSEQLGFLFLFLFVVVAAICIYLSITMSHRVQAGINRWRNEERQALEAELKQRAETLA